ncbi:ABC transporter ATP-binding protein [Tenuibacillus multivorans]|uniref:ABC-2 type transport system ATP-binding protein n=1 Tax=Tenuibacillus multivorans TaxID=237069 RepID=A0A1G9WN04_9BACI|nr:ABC transporter ATP-binding protein [Tenuibacillus multivorans]GEL78001.1 ABC transporter ATP-binding protein [Tenuibacillus multivorans]SDM85859.1 ABC-2 type transport system ATP-binding protein [Tenuibacillus multivorans]
MNQVALELKEVKKSIGKKEIIKGLNLQVNQGEVYGFIGPNGAGKTTTIRMIVGLMKIGSGDVRILGESIQSNYKEAAKNIGAIVENPELYPFMTGWQNLLHFARMYQGISKKRIKEVVSLVGLEKVIDDKVGKYSLGMRQRLGIAQAILHNPAVLILDEPTNGLDPAGIREIREYIRQLAIQENVAVIISSHLLSEIELMCDRIGIIQNGELITERYVNDEADQTEAKNKVVFEVGQAEQAANILKDKDLSFERDGDQIMVNLSRQEIPGIVKALVEHNISVYCVTETKTTLEDQFLEVTGGNVIE